MFQQPISVRAALDLMAQPGARLLAGGTDFFPALGENAVTAPLIDISHLADLRGIETDARHIRIGAATTWSEIVRHPLPRCFDALKQAAREIGSLQIQNRATIGGNLCNASPAADSVPPLLTLDALVELTSRDGTRQLPLSSFILGNRRTALQDGELVSAILVPRDVSDFTSLFAKLGARRYLVISIAMLAIALKLGADGRIATARIAIGSCSAVAQRLLEAERGLIGAAGAAEIEERLKGLDLTSISPIDDVRATAIYRRDAAATLLGRVACDAFALARAGQ